MPVAEDQDKPEDQAKKEDQFGFTPEGESLGYISLEQARVVAMRTARDQPGDYGREFSGVRMVFDLVQQEEGEDYYIITLSVRPEGDFEGRPGEEEFFIEKEGNVAYRQLRSRPRKGKGGFPKGRAAIGVVIVAIAVLAFLILVAGDDDNGSKVSPPPTATGQATQPRPTAPPTPVPPTREPATSAPTAILPPTFTPTPTQTPVVVQPKDDHGDFMETASFAVEGRSNPGVIDHPEDFDYFQFAASAGEVYSIEVELETHPDTIITLFAQNGDFLDENDDFEGLGRGSGIVFEAPFDGDYFVEVRSLNQDSDTGSYSLSLTYLGNAPAQDDHGSTIEAATGIGAGSIFGELETASDLDFFRIFAKANTNYVAEVRLESHRNTSLALMNRNGILIQENDDAEGLNGGSRITWRTPPIETEYVLMVASMDPGVGTGTYILFVEPIADQHGDSRALATPIVFETNFFGIIDPPDDLDFFRFSAKAGESYVIEAVLDGHPDTVLSLYHFRGLRVNSNDDGEGMDGGSRINWTASSAGDYFIEVKSFDQETQTGGYVLFLDRIQVLDPTPTPLRRRRPTPTPTPTPQLIQGMDPRDFATSFLSAAVEGEILSLLNVDTSYSATFYTGEPLTLLENSVSNLSSQGQYVEAGFDRDYWVLPDVRVISDTKIEVDSCEKWSVSYYNSSTRSFLSSDPTDLVPQTLTIELLATGWLLTTIKFYDPPHFCP